MAHKVFKGDWRRNDEYFKEWFKRMNKADERKKVPEEKKQVSSHEKQNDEQQQQKENDEQQIFYDTTTLRDLLRFIRNTANHPKPVYPATDKVSLHKYIMENWPNLFIVVLYQYLLDNTNTGNPTAVYQEFCG